MTKSNYSKAQFFLGLITLMVLLASIYFQYVVGLQPCPLCLMQRICVFLLLGTMMLSFWSLKKARFFSFLQIIFAGFGLFFALRQVWLQSLPAGSAPACMPGLDVLVRYFPWQTVAKALFWGSGDCAENTWSWLGISMPGWCALYFVFILLCSVGLFLYSPNFKKRLH